MKNNIERDLRKMREARLRDLGLEQTEEIEKEERIIEDTLPELSASHPEFVKAILNHIEFNNSIYQKHLNEALEVCERIQRRCDTNANLNSFLYFSLNFCWILASFQQWSWLFIPPLFYNVFILFWFVNSNYLFKKPWKYSFQEIHFIKNTFKNFLKGIWR